MLFRLFYYFILFIVFIPNIYFIYFLGFIPSIIYSSLLSSYYFVMKKDIAKKIEGKLFVVFIIISMVIFAINWFLYFFPIQKTPEGDFMVPVAQIFFGVAVGSFVSLFISMIFLQIKKNNMLEKNLIVSMGIIGLILNITKFVFSIIK